MRYNLSGFAEVRIFPLFLARRHCDVIGKIFYFFLYSGRSQVVQSFIWLALMVAEIIKGVPNPPDLQTVKKVELNRVNVGCNT